MTPRGGSREGAGRKRKYEKEKTKPRAFAIPESLSDKIDQEAEKQGKSSSEIVVAALRKVFKK